MPQSCTRAHFSELCHVHATCTSRACGWHDLFPCTLHALDRAHLKVAAARADSTRYAGHCAENCINGVVVLRTAGAVRRVRRRVRAGVRARAQLLHPARVQAALLGRRPLAHLDRLRALPGAHGPLSVNVSLHACGYVSASATCGNGRNEHARGTAHRGVSWAVCRGS